MNEWGGGLDILFRYFFLIFQFLRVELINRNLGITESILGFVAMCGELVGPGTMYAFLKFPISNSVLYMNCFLLQNLATLRGVLAQISLRNALGLVDLSRIDPQSAFFSHRMKTSRFLLMLILFMG